MPSLRRFYGQNHYHYLTVGTYRRARIFDSDRFKRKFVQTVNDLRKELGFKVWSDKKQNEKIDYIHNNPVARVWCPTPATGPGRTGGSTTARIVPFW